MSLGAEELPVAIEASAAQHAEPQPQLYSHSVSLMSLASTDYCEPLTSDATFELESHGRLVDIPDAVSGPLPQPQPEPEPEPEADAQILEALRSPKDRLFVLKLGENMESLIQERHIRSRVELTPASTYHKLLVHRCAAYYKLIPETESGSKAITIVIASDSRVPSRRVADLVPPDDSPLPAFKIMRRTPRSKTSSQTGSGNDDSAPGMGDLSDGDPSEAGSSRGSRRKPLTMSERQAQYEEARSRIFKDLEDKEKEKDMSASSSTLSLPSAGSSSGGGGGGRSSSVGESLDDTGSVDRDWVPTDANKDKKNGARRTGSAASGSSRSLRSTAPPFNGHGHSPGFIYPTLYEPTTNPSTSSTSYDSSPAPGSSSHAPYQPTLYPVYQYGAPAYLAPFPYAYYPYPHPPPPHHIPPPPDSSATSNDSPGSSPADVYPPPVFVNHYMWSAPAPPPPPHHQGHPPSTHNQAQPNHSTQGHPDFGHQQYPPPPVHAYTYPAPVPGYMQQLPPPVQSQPQQQPPPPQSQPQPQQQSQPQPPPHPYAHPPNRSQSLGPLRDGHRGNIAMEHANGTSSQPQLYQSGAYEGPIVGGSSVSRNGGSVGMPGQKRGPTRSPWSYGPGVGGAGVGLTGEAVGPRMTTARRTSGGNSVPGAFTGGRTHGDETASTASSSTSSSSSKQTFTSTSSKHPLPARPDWAVGLKPQPTLHHSNSHHSSPRSHHGHLPSQAHVHHQRPPIPMPLQSTDFPPLTVSPPNAEKRPTLGGVWAGSSTTRSILGPPLGRMNNGSGVNIMNGNGNGLPEREEQNTRLDEHDGAFERPGPKAGGELFNPNATGVGGGARAGGGTKSPTRKVQVVQEKDKDKDKASARGEAIANAILVDRVSELRIGQQENHGEQQQGNALTYGESASN